MLERYLTLKVVLGVALAIAAGACSSAGDDGSQGQDASTDQEVSEPVSLDDNTDKANTTQEPIGTSSIEVLHQMYREAKQSANRFNASCMSDRGFPQLIEANLIATDTQRFTLSNVPISIDPLNFGPYTVEQAEVIGINGVWLTLATDRPMPGRVVSRDAAFDEAFDDCEDQFDTEHGSETLTQRDSEAAYLDLVEAVENDFGEELDGRYLDLNVERLECLAQRRLDFDLRAALEDGLDGFLQAAGVVPGVMDDRLGDRPPEIEPGTVVVFPPNPPGTYSPSEAEIEFALDFVACSDEIDYLPRFEQLQASARDSALQRHEIAILGMIETIDELKLS